MKQPHGSLTLVENYRCLIQHYIRLHVYDAALFWAEKVAILSTNPKDIYWQAQCMFLLKQYHRATYILRSKNLEKTYLLCNYLTVKCLMEANEVSEALKVLNLFTFDPVVQNFVPVNCNSTSTDTEEFEDIPRYHLISTMFLQKAKILENLDNRLLAAECYKQALHHDVHCYEAFHALIKHDMLSASEEQELLNSLPITEQCTKHNLNDEVLQLLYNAKLKKYQSVGIDVNVQKFTAQSRQRHKISYTKSGGNLSYGCALSSLTSTPMQPVSISTPNMLAQNVERVDKNGPIQKETKEDHVLDSHKEHSLTGCQLDDSVLNVLKNSLDVFVSEAERRYYNCDYQQCEQLTDAILKHDPFHVDCLSIHISCQVELKHTTKICSLAHSLIDLYPNSSISWYAVGCYYYTIGKCDLSRRYLLKATALDRLFGPAWLTYGHSFAIENEHDQAMAAYFKAAQLMKGCHLPLLYIGLECGLTNNTKLAEKFFKQAHSIAPDDPFVLHEMGVIAFQNTNYTVAEKLFRQALEIVERSRPVVIAQRWHPLLNNLGHTCRKLHKFEEALELHHKALLLSPQSPVNYAAIAYNHALMSHIEEAVTWFHKALALRADDSFCTSMLNYVMEQLANEVPPYTGAPDDVPMMSAIRSTTTEGKCVIELNEKEPSTLEQQHFDMSIEVDMSDVNNVS